MSYNHETPEEKRERMRQQELKHPGSSIHGSNLSDLVGSMGWKGTGLLIVILLAAFVVYAVFN